MADDEENSTIRDQGDQFPTDLEWMEARKRISSWLAGIGSKRGRIDPPAPDELGAAFDEVASAAEDRWTRQRKASPETYAARALGDWRKKERTKRLHEHAAGAALSRRASTQTDDVRRYGRAEEGELRQAVLKHCLDEFCENWGRDWEPPAWTLSLLEGPLAAEDEKHARVECEDRKILKEIERRQRLHPEAGGPIADVIRAISTQELRRPALWTNDRPIRRFVARGVLNPVFWIAWGCIRSSDKIPSGARVSSPNKNGERAVCPNDRELTVIWLLSGGWPSPKKGWAKGFTVTELIRTAQKTIKNARIDAERIWTGK